MGILWTRDVMRPSGGWECERADEAMSDARYRAVIADDHAIVRSGLRQAFEQPGLIETDGLDVVGEAENGAEAIAAVRRHRPDVLVLDVSMPQAGGVEVLIEARRWSPDTKVVVFTGISAVGQIKALVEAGADGLFSKSASHEEMLKALPHILRGGRVIAQRFQQALDSHEPGPELTDRERQTLNLIIAGHSNREIAEGLGISIKTVDKHRTSLMAKLEVRSVTQLMARALRDGLIDPALEL